MLHVHCGDCSADVHRAADLPGDVIVWCDPVCDGPIPRGLDDETWRQVRADYLVRLTGRAFTKAENIAWHRRQDDAFASCLAHDELVLWFDACRFDQTILSRHLHWLLRHARGDTPHLSLISIGDFPGFERFCGLGELNAEQLASLFPAREPITSAMLDLGSKAWNALGAPDPTEIEQLLAAEEFTPLSFLREALVRHLEEFPGESDGLGRLQRQVLQVVAHGHRTLGDIFSACSDLEARPWFGDTTLWACIDDLAAAPTPALRIDDAAPIPRWNPPPGTTERSVSLTDTGHQLVVDDADWVDLNGIDRWLGGVHLRTRSPWRWDVRRMCLTR